MHPFIHKTIHAATASLVVLVALFGFAVTSSAAPLPDPNTASHSLWTTVATHTQKIPVAECHKIIAGYLKAHPEQAPAPNADQSCVRTDTFQVESPYSVIGGGGGCSAKSQNWSQWGGVSSLIGSYGYAQTGTFHWDYCNTPTVSNHQCADHNSSTPGIVVYTSACNDYTSGTTRYAHAAYSVGIFGVTETETLTAWCDINGNITIPQVVAE